MALMGKYEIAQLSDEGLAALIADLVSKGHRPSQMGTAETVDGNCTLKDALEEHFFRKNGYRLVWVGFDWGPVAKGWVSDHTWNGWLCPLFEKEQADKVMAHNNTEHQKLLDRGYSKESATEAIGTITYDEATDTYTLHDLYEMEGEDPLTITGRDWEGKHVYDFSNGWCWMEYDMEMVESRQDEADPVIWAEAMADLRAS